jgi:hypothetical protein
LSTWYATAFSRNPASNSLLSRLLFGSLVCVTSYALDCELIDLLVAAPDFQKIMRRPSSLKAFF